MSLSGGNCRSVSLITPLVSGVAGLIAVVQQQGGHIEHLMEKLQDVTVTLDNN